MEQKMPVAGPPVDLAVLRTWIGTNPRLLRDVLNDFVRINQPIVDELRAAGAQRAHARVRELAHKLRGSAATAGAADLGASLAELEVVAGDGALEGRPRPLQRALDDFERVRAWIEREFPPSPAAPAR